MKNKLEIKSSQCVNSNHKARFLSEDNEDYCQCSFGECKVRVLITYNGHKPYEYVLTEEEIANATKLLKEQRHDNPPNNDRVLPTSDVR